MRDFAFTIKDDKDRFKFYGVDERRGSTHAWFEWYPETNTYNYFGTYWTLRKADEVNEILWTPLLLSSGRSIHIPMTPYCELKWWKLSQP
jgi:hypothetical protein